MTKRRLSCSVLLLALALAGCDDAPSDPGDSAGGQHPSEAGASSPSMTVGDSGASGPTFPSGLEPTSDAGSRPRTADAGTQADPSSGMRQDGGGAPAMNAGGSTSAPDTSTPMPTPDASPMPTKALWKPKPGARWQWDLSGKITKFDVAVDVYDIDGFENGEAEVKRLQDMGKKVICYISVGTYEPERPDAKDFPKAALGKYWPEWGETYIDIRNEGVRKVMQKRLQMCADKGFDGIEPDNMDMFEGGESDTGFPLTKADGIAYAKWLAAEAHARGLSIGQKNAASITGDIEASYDWALTEDCFVDNWCNAMKPYTAHDKAMFMCEYTDTDVDFAAACKAGKAQKFSPILKDRELTPSVEFCP